MRATDYLKENKKAMDLLQRIETFKAFSDDDINSFMEVGKLMEYEAGETIINKGETDHWVYFLVSGEVKVVKGEKTFAILRRGGELFGEMGVIDGAPRSASVWALTKTMVLGVDCSRMGEERKQNTRIFHYTIFRLFAESLAERLRETTNEVIKLQSELKQKDALIAKLTGKTPGDEGEGDKTLWI